MRLQTLIIYRLGLAEGTQICGSSSETLRQNSRLKDGFPAAALSKVLIFASATLKDCS